MRKNLRLLECGKRRCQLKRAQQKSYYLIGQKFVGQKCRNFSLVSKILSDETFCPSKILSNISIQKSGKNRTKLSKFRLGVENFVRRNILSNKVLEKKQLPEEEKAYVTTKQV